MLPSAQDNSLVIFVAAYRGLLGEVYHSGNRPPTSTSRPQSEQQKQQQKQKVDPPDSPPTTATDQTADNSDLPKIAGINYQRRENVVIAVGNSFDKKELLKSADFKWDKADKNWYKEVTVH